MRRLRGQAGRIQIVPLQLLGNWVQGNCCTQTGIKEFWTNLIGHDSSSDWYVIGQRAIFPPFWELHLVPPARLLAMRSACHKCNVLAGQVLSSQIFAHWTDIRI